MACFAATNKDEANHALEKRLWAAADLLRGSSGRKASLYLPAVRDLMFVRFRAPCAHEARH